MEHSSRTRLLSAVVVAVVFGAGVLIGFAADTNLGAEPADPATEEVAEEAPTRDRTPIYLQLQPTPEEQVRIDSIVQVHRERTTELDKETRRAFRQGFREILLSTRQAIREVFPPEKGDEYQRLLDEYDAQQAAERESRENRK